MADELGIQSLPRVSLGCLPTPLQFAPRLSTEIGLEVWFKRDDLTGLGLGGNKVRPLEFLLGDGLARGCDVLVTGSGPQSNWSLLAALAARRCGLDSELCFYGDPPAASSGNLLLHEQWTGARIRYTGAPERATVDRLIEQTAEQLRREGRNPLVLPRGGATTRGSLGYFVGAAEIRDQVAATGAGPATVWLATGSCGTQAGLVLGASTGLLARVVGVTVSRPVSECHGRVAELSAGAAELVDVPPPSAHQIELVDGWIGAGYGKPSGPGRAAAELVAATEAVLLDPVFGAKAMAALIHAARAGELSGPVVFLVSGGAATLFSSGTDL